MDIESTDLFSNFIEYLGVKVPLHLWNIFFEGVNILFTFNFLYSIFFLGVEMAEEVFWQLIDIFFDNIMDGHGLLNTITDLGEN